METSVELLDCAEVCRFFGGNRPINPATLYRGIRKGRFPKPIKVGPGSSRWLRDECEAALRIMVEGRAVYPTLPDTSPWATPNMPELPLGYSVDSVEPQGVSHTNNSLLPRSSSSAMRHPSWPPGAIQKRMPLAPAVARVHHRFSHQPRTPLVSPLLGFLPLPQRVRPFPLPARGQCRVVLPRRWMLAPPLPQSFDAGDLFDAQRQTNTSWSLLVAERVGKLRRLDRFG
jgi:predicted DNA-binding transcriptional regulator AlpA